MVGVCTVSLAKSGLVTSFEVFIFNGSYGLDCEQDVGGERRPLAAYLLARGDKRR
jgi:hypothetical protein